MAASTLCVSCAQLPQKKADLAIKKIGCPECETLLGVTSYGAAFRLAPSGRSSWLTPRVISGMVVGCALLSVVTALIGLGFWTKEQIEPPKRAAEPAQATNHLARVPEVAVDDLPANITPATAKRRIQDLIAKIKNENAVKQDQFLVLHMSRRPELRGLPFVMGDACRRVDEKARSFQSAVEAVRNAFDHDSGRFAHGHKDDGHHTAFWNAYQSQDGKANVNSESGVAALTQMLAPERRTLRASLVAHLSKVPRDDAAVALARLAVFDPDLDVREAAIKALKEEGRAKDEVGAVLMHGLRYPLPAVAKQAAHAMLALERRDLLPQIAAFLDEKAPGDPTEQIVDGKPVCVVREVVKINHHRNCLLCHPPAQSAQTFEVPGVMPIPGTPFPSSPSEAYGNAQSIGDPMVRADTTYLRQDFSLMMPVENAAPWPEMQRFDFLVRTRIVEGQELTTLKAAVASRAASYLSDNHKAALLVLRQMTGQDAAPTQAAWLRVLGE